VAYDHWSVKSKMTAIERVFVYNFGSRKTR